MDDALKDKLVSKLAKDLVLIKNDIKRKRAAQLMRIRIHNSGVSPDKINNQILIVDLAESKACYAAKQQEWEREQQEWERELAEQEGKAEIETAKLIRHNKIKSVYNFILIIAFIVGITSPISVIVYKVVNIEDRWFSLANKERIEAGQQPYQNKEEWKQAELEKEKAELEARKRAEAEWEAGRDERNRRAIVDMMIKNAGIEGWQR